MRICLITPRFPYPLLKGDSLRVYHQLEGLSRRHQITLVSLNDSPLNPEQLEPLSKLCEQVHVVPLPRWRAALNLATGLFTPRPLQVEYHRSSRFERTLSTVLARGRFDALHVSLIRMLPYVWNLVGKQVIVVDLIDSMSLNLLSRRNEARGPMRLAYDLEYRRVRDYERAVVQRFPSLVISSPIDQQLLGGPHIQVNPNGVDLEKFQFRGLEGRNPATLIFTGNMAYPPNQEAVSWFVRQVWPLLRPRWPRLQLEIVGADPPASIRALAGPGSNIQVLGRVPKMEERLGKATVAICPMQSGSGIQNKVLEAMATGTPVVSTAVANQGVQGCQERELLIGNTPEEFAFAVDRLLLDAGLRRWLGANGRALVEQRFRWEVHVARLEALYAGQKPEATLEPSGWGTSGESTTGRQLMAGKSATKALLGLGSETR
ncbi:glycosyltransferase [Archangium minus]|uniref:Glycosyltransferase n=1 Tax=Archangium minus TaxID=83450 RepID=A0ABY9WZJ6_9BACT|nr:glycosyltransferase [Archangium minus]